MHVADFADMARQTKSHLMVTFMTLMNKNDRRSRPGNVRFRAESLQLAMNEGTVSRKELARRSGISEKTLSRIFQGAHCQAETARRISEALGTDPKKLLELGPSNASSMDTNDRWPADWDELEKVTGWTTASNGLQYRTYKLKHKRFANEFARGKRYDLDNVQHDLVDEFQQHLLTRHAEVCRRLARSHFFPVNQENHRLGDHFVVIDSWPDGTSLTNLQEQARAKVAAIAGILSDAIAELHRHDIVLRDLHPDRIFFDPETNSLTIVDLELSKLMDGTPTVAPHELVPNPYRAPECKLGHKFDNTVDFYSWAKLLLFVATGSPEASLGELKKLGLPRKLDTFVANCLSDSYRKRPTSFASYSRALKSWSA